MCNALHNFFSEVEIPEVLAFFGKISHGHWLKKITFWNSNHILPCAFCNADRQCLSFN